MSEVHIAHSLCRQDFKNTVQRWSSSLCVSKGWWWLCSYCSFLCSCSLRYCFLLEQDLYYCFLTFRNFYEKVLLPCHPPFSFQDSIRFYLHVVKFLAHDFLQALLEYEKYRLQCGELPYLEYDNSNPKGENQVTFVQMARPSQAEWGLNFITWQSFLFLRLKITLLSHWLLRIIFQLRHEGYGWFHNLRVDWILVIHLKDTNHQVSLVHVVGISPSSWSLLWLSVKVINIVGVDALV